LTAIPEKTHPLTVEELTSTILNVTGSVGVTSNPTQAVTVEEGATVSINVDQMDEIRESLKDLIVELRVASQLFNEGMNQKENLDTLRKDVAEELNQ
jgi:hypothetical protein